MFARELERRIEAAYRDSAYTRGWRLLASPTHVLDGSEIAFIGLNPGGSLIDPDHAIMAPSSASAYVSESWGGHPPGRSPLQLQVRALFAALGAEPENVLAGNLVPFRSQSWANLPHKQSAIIFGKTIWSEIFARSRPRLVVTMGRPAFESIAEVLEVSAFDRLQAGWGTVTLSSGTNGEIRLVGLPHLSRFTIIGREQSHEALAAAFGPFWKAQG